MGQNKEKKATFLCVPIQTMATKEFLAQYGEAKKGDYWLSGKQHQW